MKIDSHQHFWKYDPQKHSWIGDHMSVLRRDFLPDELKDLIKNEGMNGTIAVQADQSEQENEFLLKLAEDHDFIKGIVGWVDLKSDELRSRLQYYKSFPKIKGFRHVVQDEPSGFLLDPKFVEGVRTLHDFGYSYDILIFHHQLAETVQFVQLLPEMKLVIDHCAKPDIINQEFDQWFYHMSQLAAYKHINVKLSGLVTEAKWDSWQPFDIEHYISAIVELFGPDRVMIGTDWPVCTLAASYAKVIDLVKNVCQDFPISAIEKIMGRNAADFYNITE